MTSISRDLKYVWPHGAWACVTPIVVLEVWSDEVTSGTGMPGAFVSGGAQIKDGRPNIRAEKIVEFGGKVGIWRLLEVLDLEGVPASLIASGRAVEMYPEAARAFIERGSEIVGHSYAQDVRSYNFDNAEEERKNIRRSVEAIETVTGQRPRGWTSPGANPSEHTMRLLVEEGFTWSGDYANHELPYVEETGDGPLVILPYSGTAGVNDYEIHLMQGNPPSTYVEHFKSTVDSLHSEYERYGRPAMIRVAAHAHLFGRPWGRHAFLEAIRYARSLPGAWFSTRTGLADVVLDYYRESKQGVE